MARGAEAEASRPASRSASAHRFRMGEQVYLERRTGHTAVSGAYEIVRLLPAGPGGFQYRIKSRLERTERVVEESDIKRSQT